jgi:hypothetical protein
MKHRVLTGTMIVVAGVIAAAQQAPVELPATPPGTVAINFSSSQGETRAAVERALTVVEARVTTGRPYSAEATTEFVQVLGDGNRINRRTMVRVYRDNDDRTRREEFGSGDAPTLITIYDPVSHVSYVLDPAKRTARKSAVRTVTPTMRRQEEAAVAGARGRSGGVTSTVEERQKVEAGTVASTAVSPTAGAITVVPGTAPGPQGGGGRGGQVSARRGTTEPLGQQMVGGVMATGTRTTTVIPAGQIGNERELKIVSEQWMSEDLQLVVLTKHTDPRSGETTYRLTNIVRAEPAAGMFDVPADYTVTEATSYMRSPQ